MSSQTQPQKVQVALSMICSVMMGSFLVVGKTVQVRAADSLRPADR